MDSNNSNEEKCSCEQTDSAQCCEERKDKKSKISFASFGFNLRRGRSLHARKSKGKNAPSDTTSISSGSDAASTSSKKSPKWVSKFNCAKKQPKTESRNCCQCTCYRKTDENDFGVVLQLPTYEPLAINDPKSKQNDATSEGRGETSSAEVRTLEESAEVMSRTSGNPNAGSEIIITAPFGIQWIRTVHEDCDEAARIQRAREIEQGVEAPANFRPLRRVQLLYSDSEVDIGTGMRRLRLVCPADLTVSLRGVQLNNFSVRSGPLDCHTQVDFIHCLVPDLLDITNCSFYWGKMDRYEAERLLDGKPEGTFLLRDSAQEEFLFSVSFRKYGRSLHARIEQWNHKFSFDSHDPGVYTSETVSGLIEHYKDPSSCMFFEPMLTWPLHRNFTFSLQHLCRAVVVNRIMYDDVNQLQLPKSLKSYLKEYHYKQKIRVERFDDDFTFLDLRSVP